MQDVTAEDLDDVRKLLSSGVLSVPQGGILTRFEKRYARFAGNQFCVATCNGTSALYAALWAVGVREGDDVAVCDYGFHGMAAAVVALGARVVPVDCHPASLTMDPEDLVRARTPRMKAVLVHNPWGVPADWSALKRATDLPLVSDASHAHGALYDGLPLGAQATISCWSMGYGKLISGGELGAATTDDPELADRMMILGHVNRNERHTSLWTGNAVGLKLRPHPVALTLAFHQVKRFPEKLALLKAHCSQVIAASGLRVQEVPAEAERSYWKLVFHGPGEGNEPNHYWPTLQHQSLFAWPGNQVLARECPVAREVVPRLATFSIKVESQPHDGVESQQLSALKPG